MGLYLSLKQLIKKLSATPIIQAQSINGPGEEQLDSQASLQANKATFFFRLVSGASAFEDARFE